MAGQMVTKSIAKHDKFWVKSSGARMFFLGNYGTMVPWCHGTPSKRKTHTKTTKKHNSCKNTELLVVLQLCQLFRPREASNQVRQTLLCRLLRIRTQLHCKKVRIIPKNVPKSVKNAGLPPAELVTLRS